MTPAFDDRLLTVTIELGAQTLVFDQGYSIQAFGTKMVSSLLADCEVRIFNLKKETRDQIITLTSPFNPSGIQQVRLTIQAGRKSTGMTTLYIGDIIGSNPTQPPDIGITLRSITAAQRLLTSVSNTQPGVVTTQTIAQQIATDLGTAEHPVKLDFQGTVKNVANYQFSGPAGKQWQKLQDVGGYHCFIDNDTFYVKDNDKPLEKSNNGRTLDKTNGMIGVPDVNEQGIKVKFLLDNITSLGTEIAVKSELNPAANGNWIINKLEFDLATRDTPWYFIAYARPSNFVLTK